MLLFCAAIQGVFVAYRPLGVEALSAVLTVLMRLLATVLVKVILICEEGTGIKRVLSWKSVFWAFH